MFNKDFFKKKADILKREQSEYDPEVKDVLDALDEPNADIERGKFSFTVEPSRYENLEDQISYDSLMKEIHNIIENSEFVAFNEIVDDKVYKLNKMEINKVYTYIISKVKEPARQIEIFSIVSEYFEINPKKLYSSLSNKYKHELLILLDKDTDILKKKNIRKLF